MPVAEVDGRGRAVGLCLRQPVAEPPDRRVSIIVIVGLGLCEVG